MGNECCKSGGTGSDVVVAEPKREPDARVKDDEPQAEPASDHADSQDMGGDYLELVFRCKEKTVKSFPEGGSEVLDKAVEASAIVRAWFGDPSDEWSGKKGKDVTSKVKGLIKNGKEVAPTSEVLGDTAPKVSKVLLVEMNQEVQKSFKFDKKPLSITFADKKMPPIVTNAAKNGYGHKNGVTNGMVLVEVKGEDITGMSYKDAIGKLVAAVEPLPKE